MPTIRWFKEQIEVEKTKNVTIGFDEQTYVCTLRILDCIPEEEGTYRCVAQNEVGLAETSASLIIESKYKYCL